LVEEEAYKKLADSAVSFLQGRRRELIPALQKQMEEAAEDLNYEEAARLRDRIGALTHVLEKQNVDWVGNQDQDVLGFYTDDDACQLCILFVRGGKLIGSKSFAPVKTKAEIAEIISSLLQQFYDNSEVPEEIILPCNLPEENVIVEWLSDEKGKKVLITVPRRGAKKALLEMACANSRELLESARKKEEQKTAALSILQEKLTLSRLPRRIECYDISNISGKQAVGSQVVFQDGEPDKAAYRRFRVKTAEEPDDYGMMREVLTRRFTGAEEMPDLVVVDGGKGQLNVALSVLKDLKIKLDVIGLAKEERTFLSGSRIIKKKTAKAEDRVYLPRRKDAVFLSAFPQALSLLQRLRDEAHRFAVSFHHKLKQKNDLRSLLEAIPDVGNRRKRMLLRHFGSAEQVRNASFEDLQKVSGIGKELAEKIYSHLREVK
jgi:excinuclease ABC subunit C